MRPGRADTDANRLHTPLALDATGLSRRYGDVTAVDGVDIRVSAGRLTALLGPSGCGKTTVLRMVAGLDDEGSGRVTIAGRLVDGDGRWVAPERRGVGLVFHDSVLFPHLDVAANVGYGVPRQRRDTETQRMLELLSIDELANRMPHELSGGQQQRAALARTLAARPDLVLLDEPFSQLDQNLRDRVRADMLLALARTESSALLVTHDQAEALAVADDIVVMADGLVRQTGSPRDVYERPADRFVAEFIGHATLVPAVPTTDGGRRGWRSSLGATELENRPALSDERAGGRRVLAVVRPEDVVLESPTAPVRGRIVGVVFEGRDDLVHLELDDGTPLLARSARRDRAAVGDAVGVTLAGPVWSVPAHPEVSSTDTATLGSARTRSGRI